MRNVSDKFVEKIKTRILYPITSSPKITPFKDNVEKHCRTGLATDNNTIRRMRFSCSIIKATNTNSEYIILTYYVSTKTIFRRTRLNVTIIRTYCVHCLSSSFYKYVHRVLCTCYVHHPSHAVRSEYLLW